MLRSRALEYRESAAKACIERICSGGVAEPVRYLRRAVELVADTGCHVQVGDEGCLGAAGHAATTCGLLAPKQPSPLR